MPVVNMSKRHDRLHPTVTRLAEAPPQRSVQRR
jgi:hypothetical protein